MKRPQTILVSAGPTRERFDDVRFLSNGSTGGMGIEVARALFEAGFGVELFLGPTHLAPPPGVSAHRFETAVELEALAAEHWPNAHGFVATAAVCDYRPAERIDGKRKKEPGDWNVRLVRNPDVIANRGRDKGDRITVGFALESLVDEADRVAEARRKLEAKSLDVIILNGPANMGSDRGDFVWIESDSSSRAAQRAGEASASEASTPGATPAELGRSLLGVDKRDLARRIAKYFVQRFA